MTGPLRIRLVLSVFILIAASLALSPIVCAASVDLWKYNLETFSYNNITYTVKILSDYQVIRLEAQQAGAPSFSILNNTCHEEAVRNICYYGMDVSSDKLRIDDFGNILAPVHVVIIEKAAKLEITRTQSTTTPAFGNPFNMTLTIKNKGDLAVESLTYSLALPAGVKYQDGTSGVNIVGNKLVWDSGALEPNRTLIFAFTLLPIDYGKKELIPTLTYVSQGVQTAQNPGTFSFTVQNPYTNPYTLTHGLSQKTIGPTDRATWSIVLTSALGNQSMSADVTFRVPSGLAVVDTPSGSDQTGNTVRSRFNLPAKEARTLSIAVEPLRTGVFALQATVRVNGTDVDADVPFDIVRQYNDSLTVTLPSLKGTISLTRDDVTVGEEVALTLDLLNPSKDESYYNISGILDLGSENVSIHTDKLDPQETYRFTKSILVTAPAPPAGNASANGSARANASAYAGRTFNFSGSYQASNGQRFPVSTGKTMTIFDKDAIIQLSAKADKASVKRQDSVTMTVKVKNRLDAPLVGINVYDSYPGTLVLKSGKSQADVILNGGIEQTAYAYTLTVPDDFEYKTFYLKTYLQLDWNGHNLSRAVYTKISVTNPRNGSVDEPDPAIIRIADNATGLGAQGANASATPGGAGANASGTAGGSLQPVKGQKTGFWQSFVAFLKKFFGG